ncbi:MAG: trypsin-like peptidase domain-containing protein [Lentisphaeraceae bacterium]|nr:trypsin-like peptidase domain-containing protein [Lentisphaeraceae bacterium]
MKLTFYALILLTFTTFAQNALPSSDRVNGSNVKQSLTKLISPTNPAIVQILDENEVVSTGIIISSVGLIITKNSELEKLHKVKTYDGSIFDSITIGFDKETNLALLKINSTNLKALDFPKENLDLERGDFLISALPKGKSKIGVLSGLPRDIIKISGVIGVMLGDENDEGVIVNQSVTDGPAHAADIRNGDIIEAIDNIPTKSHHDILKALSGKGPGKTVLVDIKRTKMKIQKKLVLGDRHITFGMFNRNLEMSGRVSKRVDGFKNILQHDIPIDHTESASPIFNIQGKIAGLNIAKANRAEYFALSNSEVHNAISRLKKLSIPEHKLSSKSNTLDLKELQKVQEKIKSLQAKARSVTVGLSARGASGSGVIVSEDGIIATAAHISTEPNTPVKVYLENGTTYNAIALGLHPKADVALIKITDKGIPKLPYSKLVKSSTVSKGDWCFVLGHPNGFDQERGSVLRIGRVIDLRTYLIWTDCTLLGGDSGGPLFDLDGNIIGINSRIFESNEDNIHGPADILLTYWDELLKSKKISDSKKKAFLGVGTKSNGIGIKITEVVKNSSADRAGVKVGDVILSINREPILNTNELIEFLKDKKIGKEILINLIRSGEELQLKATLGLQP